jgi:DNA repair ATPase RecN
MAKMIEQAMNQKEQLLAEIAAADQQHQVNEQLILEQEERMDDLRNIERKLMMALK